MSDGVALRSIVHPRPKGIARLWWWLRTLVVFAGNLSKRWKLMSDDAFQPQSGAVIWEWRLSGMNGMLKSDLVPYCPIVAADDLQPQSGDFTSADAAVPQRSNPVQEHVDAIVDDLTAGRVSGGQRATLGRALQDAAIGGIGRKHE